MSKPLIPFWAVTGSKTEPPVAKKNLGFDAGKPEGSGYFNWWAELTWKWIRGTQGHYADIVVGSAGEVASNNATHTVSDWVAALVNNDHVMFLAGTHVAVRNEDITELRCKIEMEQGATLDLVTFTLTISGDENRFTGKLDNVDSNDFALSGDHNDILVWIANAGATPINDTGTGNRTTQFLVS